MGIHDRVGLVNRFTVGFDNLFNELQRYSNSTTFPPHNIVKISENEYLLEYAVAGFKKDQISVQQEEGLLTIEGRASDDNREYVHKGISGRSFSNSIRLADFVNVVGAEMVDGLLNVRLEKIIPAELKPRQIQIK